LNIRPKLFLLVFALALAALLALCVVSYWQSTRERESALRESLRRDADWIAIRLTHALTERESSLTILAQSSALRTYLRCHPPVSVFYKTAMPLGDRPVPGVPTSEAGNNDGLGQVLDSHKKRIAGCGGRQTDKSTPADLAGVLTAFLVENRKYYGPLSVLNSAADPVIRAQVIQNDSSNQNEAPVVTFQTDNLPTNRAGGPDSIGGDESFVSARDPRSVRVLVERGPVGASVRYTVPVLPGLDDLLRDSSYRVLGALVTDFKLDQLFKEQVSDIVGALNGAPTGLQTSREVIILDHAGTIYYCGSLGSFQPVATAMPGFKPVAAAMMADETGAQFYPHADGHRWLASYRPLGQHDLLLAVTTDYSRAVGPVRQELLRNLLFSLVIALVVALPLTLIAQRRSGRSLERLTQGAVAIAKGRLDQKLVVSSAENQLLADSMNAVTARLRDQLAREAESRQFDSFLRLSAMLTHDLKNAIAGLSLLVSNMDRQFDNPEFRADAMNSLREATGKLKKLVTKLSEPVNTMSGEHQRPRPTDLVPIIRRVLGSLTSTSNQFHKIEIELPQQLIAETEAERMEKVIENLAINALEAMGSKSGVLRITGGSGGDGKVFFSVTDTGPGMTKDFQERRLFHPFATTKHGGVGLGLYTCREVVRAYGGSIEVTSDPGVGTTFRVVLPSVQSGE
jgi:signal transduction histidine kinase